MVLTDQQVGRARCAGTEDDVRYGGVVEVVVHNGAVNAGIGEVDEALASLASIGGEIVVAYLDPVGGMTRWGINGDSVLGIPCKVIPIDNDIAHPVKPHAPLNESELGVGDLAG